MNALVLRALVKPASQTGEDEDNQTVVIISCTHFTKDRQQTSREKAALGEKCLWHFMTYSNMT